MRWWALLALIGCEGAGHASADMTRPPSGFEGDFRGIGAVDADGGDSSADGSIDGASDGPTADAGSDTGGAGDAAPDVPLSEPPLQLTFEAVAQDSGALRITDLAFLPEPAGDFLVLDKDGYVIHMRMQGDGAVRLGAFQIEETWFDSDAGLISVALDPDFVTNRFFYLGWSTNRDTNVVDRFTWRPDDLAGTGASARRILEVVGEGAPRSWHNVGSIGFTDEGYLWALFGDKVLEEYAQDVESPLGALLRVIPDRTADGEGYTVPADNPYADGSGHPAVYAKGMRSPWKGTHRGGVWYWGDVGLNQIEEINTITEPGQDFGWPSAEGPCVAGDIDAQSDEDAQNDEDEDGVACEALTDPWLWYGRDVTGWVAADLEATSSRMRSVWVGVIYEPNPADPYRGRWDDVLVFGDAFSGFVRAARVDEGVSWHAGHLTLATAMRQAPDGYVYATALGTWPPDAPEIPAPIYRVKLAE